MATYSEETFVDQITIEPHTGSVLWREVTVVYRDGVEWKRDYLRGSVEVDRDHPKIPASVAPFRALADTPAARAAAAARRAKNEELAPVPTPRGGPNA